MSWEKNNLALCELIHPHIHGTDIDNCGHYLVTWYIDWKKAYMNHNVIFGLPDELRTRTPVPRRYIAPASRDILIPHPFIRAYWNILKKKGFHTLQIVEGIELDSGEHIAILKTFWLRIFQRKWRNICKDKKIARLKSKELYYRSIHGKWRGSGI